MSAHAWWLSFVPGRAFAIGQPARRLRHGVGTAAAGGRHRHAALSKIVSRARRQRAHPAALPALAHRSRALNLAPLALWQLEAAVVDLPFLHTAASAAYQAYMRSYATHSKAVQRVLHIGQVRPPFAHCCEPRFPRSRSEVGAPAPLQSVPRRFWLTAVASGPPRQEFCVKGGAHQDWPPAAKASRSEACDQEAQAGIRTGVGQRWEAWAVTRRSPQEEPCRWRARPATCGHCKCGHLRVWCGLTLGFDGCGDVELWVCMKPTTVKRLCGAKSLASHRTDLACTRSCGCEARHVLNVVGDDTWDRRRPARPRPRVRDFTVQRDLAILRIYSHFRLHREFQ